MLSRSRLKQLSTRSCGRSCLEPQLPQAPDRAGLVTADLPQVADHVRRDDYSPLAFLPRRLFFSAGPYGS
jgi:hypothetical protein